MHKPALAGVIYPDWDVPENVKAISTTRLAGVSKGEYASNNLAMHVDDDPDAVMKNRHSLVKEYQLPATPVWLEQIHGTQIIDAANDKARQADASFSKSPGVVCVVMTADCLPVLLTNSSGTQVAAIHAGWRGLSGGIVEKTVARFKALADNAEIVAWLGPAISSKKFEVGIDVYSAFVDYDSDAKEAFVSIADDKWLADIYALARLRLVQAGISKIAGGNYCTYMDEALFFSHRRSGVCGRMASLIWLEN